MHTTPELTKGQVTLLATSPEARPVRMTVLDRSADRIDAAPADGTPLPDGWAHRPSLHLTYVDDNGVETTEMPVLALEPGRVVLGPPAVGSRVHRRQYARVRAEVPMTCLVVDDRFTRFEPLAARVRDIGGGGAALLCDAGFARGARVVVALALPESVVALGTVVGQSAGGTQQVLHVHFDAMREPDREVLHRFVLGEADRAAGGSGPA